MRYLVIGVNYVGGVDKMKVVNTPVEAQEQADEWLIHESEVASTVHVVVEETSQ